MERVPLDPLSLWVRVRVLGPSPSRRPTPKGRGGLIASAFLIPNFQPSRISAAPRSNSAGLSAANACHGPNSGSRWSVCSRKSIQRSTTTWRISPAAIGSGCCGGTRPATRPPGSRAPRAKFVQQRRVMLGLVLLHAPSGVTRTLARRLASRHRPTGRGSMAARSDLRNWQTRRTASNNRRSEWGRTCDRGSGRTSRSSPTAPRVTTSMRSSIMSCLLPVNCRPSVKKPSAASGDDRRPTPRIRRQLIRRQLLR